MKIIVIGTRGFPEVQGGIERYCENLYTHMADYGPEIIVFTRKPYVNAELDLFEGVRLVAVDCPRNKYFENMVHSFKCIIKARMLKPDIIHIYSSYIYAPLVRMLGMKTVINVMCQSYKSGKWGFFARLFLRVNETIGVKFANSVIAISKPIEVALRKLYKKPVKFIPNGVHIPELSSTDETVFKLGLAKYQYVLSVGRFVEGKGFEDLIEAFTRGAFEGWKLVVVGHADHKSHYSDKLEIMARMNNDIVLTGFIPRDELKELYSHAGIFVLPSYDEGMPTVLLEAMSYGLSCIATDIPAHISLDVSDERLYKPGDIDALATKMKQFMEKTITEVEKREQINLISEKYSWKKIASETLAIYEQTARGY